MSRATLTDALAHRDTVLRAFIGADGPLSSIPTKLTKRLVILERDTGVDWLAGGTTDT